MNTFFRCRVAVAAAALAVAFVSILLACGGQAEPAKSLRHNASYRSSNLDEAAVPDNTDPRVFQLLCDELKRLLLERAYRLGSDRFSSGAPTGEAGQVTDLAYSSVTGNLTWTYVNAGDYALDGEVGVPDITPIAQNYLASTIDGQGDDDYEAWIDQSGDGEVGIPDITPIATNYLNGVFEYSILTANSLSGTFNEIGRVSLRDAIDALPQGAFPIVFNVPLPPDALDYVQVQPLDSGSNPGAPSTACAVGADIAPAVNSVTPLTGTEGTQVFLTAEVIGTEPITFDWNFGGGATPNTAIGNPTPYITLGAGGSYSASVTATNASGSDTFDFTLTVTESGDAPVIVSVSPPGGVTGSNAAFSANVTGAQPLTYDWDFGSGATPSTSSDTSPIVALASAGEYSATLTVTNAAGSDTFNFYYASVTSQQATMQNLFFLHHSTGLGFISEGDMRGAIAYYNTEHATSFAFWDHGYNGDGITDPNGNPTGTNYAIPNDNTDPDGLFYLWTSTEADAVTARSQILDNHDVIAFKSCFPASGIYDDALLAQYKTWYLAIRDTIDAHPSNLFIVMSTPPYHRLATNSEDAARARAFANWLGSGEFVGTAHPNLLYFNLFDRLAQADDGSATANMLKYEYEGSHDADDSHPNLTANQTIGPTLATFMCSWGEWYSDKLSAS